MTSAEKAMLQATFALAAREQHEAWKRHDVAVRTAISSLQPHYGDVQRLENTTGDTTFGCTDLIMKRPGEEQIRVRLVTYYDEGVVKTKVSPR